MGGHRRADSRGLPAGPGAVGTMRTSYVVRSILGVLMLALIVPLSAVRAETTPRTEFPLRAEDTGAYVDVVQKRLTWLGYSIEPAERQQTRLGASTLSGLHAFQDKFGFPRTPDVNQRTWDRLKSIAGPVGSLPAACTDVDRAICVDRRQMLVRLVERGEVVLTTDARFGILSEATRTGTFRVHFRSEDHFSTIYRTPMPYALFFSGGQAIHYSSWFARDGYAGGSHGCVNLRDREKAAALFRRSPLGTVVHIA